MNYRILIFTIITIFFSMAKAEPGFMRIDNPKIPAAVKRSSLSVLKLIAPGGNNESVITSQFKDKFKSEKDFFQRAQLKYCEKTKQPVCEIFAQMAEGSAFTMGDGRDLYTSLHNFFEVLSIESKKLKTNSRSELINGLQAKPLFLALANAAQDPIFNPKDSVAFPVFFNPDTYLLSHGIGTMTSSLGRLSDIIQIKLPYRVNPLVRQKSGEKSGEGDEVYIAGYPMETHNRSAVGGEDSDGESLQISKGRIIPIEALEKISGKLSPLEKQTLKENLIFMDADCEHGNSGGPVLNKKGEVIGLVIGVARKPGANASEMVSIALKNFDQVRLEKIWNSLK